MDRHASHCCAPMQQPIGSASCSELTTRESRNFCLPSHTTGSGVFCPELLWKRDVPRIPFARTGGESAVGRHFAFNRPTIIFRSSEFTYPWCARRFGGAVKGLSLTIFRGPS